jgi:hypothetical protein
MKMSLLYVNLQRFCTHSSHGNQTKKGLNITQIVVTLTLGLRPGLGCDKKGGQEQNYDIRWMKNIPMWNQKPLGIKGKHPQDFLTPMCLMHFKELNVFNFYQFSFFHMMLKVLCIIIINELEQNYNFINGSKYGWGTQKDHLILYSLDLLA